MAISEEAKKRLLEAKQTVTNPTESQSGFSASTQERLQAYKEWGAPVLQEMDDARRAGYEERKALGIDFTAGDPEAVTAGKAQYDADRNAYTQMNRSGRFSVGMMTNAIQQKPANREGWDGLRDNYTYNMDDTTLNRFYAMYGEDKDKAINYANEYNKLKAQMGAIERQEQYEKTLRDLGLVKDDLGEGFNNVSRGVAKTMASIGATAFSPYDIAKGAYDLAAGGGRFSDEFIQGNETPFTAMKTDFQRDVKQAIDEATTLEFGDNKVTQFLGLNGEKVMSNLYSIGYSTLESAVIAGIGGGTGTVLLGTSAGMQTLLQQLQAGVPSDKALAQGLIAGLTEWATERYITLEKVLKAKNMKGLEGKAAVKQYLVNQLKAAGAEGSEEFFGSVIDTIADVLINQDSSEIASLKAEYLAAGDKNPLGHAILDKVGEAASEGLSGAISGLLMSAGGTAVQNAGANATYSRSIAEAQKSGTYQDLLDSINATEYMEGREALTDKTDVKDVRRAYRASAETIETAAIKERLESQGVPVEDSQRYAEIIFDMGNDYATKRSDRNSLSPEAQKVAEEYERGEANWVRDAKAFQYYYSTNETPQAGITEQGAEVEKQIHAEERREEITKITGENTETESSADIEVTPEETFQSAANVVGMNPDVISTAYAKRSDEVSVNRYANATELAFRYGAAGMKLADVVRNIGFSMDSALSEAYKNGQESYVKGLQNNKLRIDRKTANVSYISNEEASKMGVDTVDIASLSDDQNAYIDALDTISKAYGVKMVLFESSGDTSIENGHYDPTTNSIYIDASSTSGLRKYAMLSTASHELVHDFRRVTPEVFNALRQFVIDKYYDGSETKFNEAVKRIMQQRKLQGFELASPDDAVEELVAMSCEKVFDDPNMISRLAETLESKSTPDGETLLDKVIKWFDDLIKRLKSALANLTGIKANPYAEEMSTKDLEHIRDLFVQAAREIQSGRADSQLEQITESLPTDTTEATNVEDVTKYSLRSFAEGCGFSVDPETLTWTREGSTIEKVTAIDIMNSPIGALIDYSNKQGYISDTDAKEQRDMFVRMANMCIGTNDVSMAMQFVGSSVFTGLKSNSDKQYNTTYDFPSICTKTQAVIDAMSREMVRKKSGLTKEEILALYDRVWFDGNPVPCPECYVFSRWVGIGGLLDNVWAYQSRYAEMKPSEVAALYKDLESQVMKVAEENGLSMGKAKTTGLKIWTKEYNKLVEKQEKVKDGGAPLTEAEERRMSQLEPMMDNVKAMTYIKDVYFADKDMTRVNPKFFVPAEVLFDLNKGEEFARDYKAAWGFRTTQGAGYGKAITPYAEAVVGEGIQGTKSMSGVARSKAAKATADNVNDRRSNPFLESKGVLNPEALKVMTVAKKKQLNQAYIGGQRFQSTSDARYENFLDYVIAALEVQAMHGMVQVYTKVSGAVDAFNAWGFSINQSLMPLGGGIENGVVKDTANGGMKPSVAFDNRANDENAGTITIGVNDEHIRAMFNDVRRDFIIPYHASGGDRLLISAFRSILDKGAGKVLSTDYSSTQAEKLLNDELLENVEDVHKFREQRLAILTRKGTLDMDYIDAPGNELLRRVYDSVTSGRYKGAQLTKGVCESQIFPNEYWDTSLTYEESGKIVEDYLEYCRRLGMLHKFSGTVQRFNKSTGHYELYPVKGRNAEGDSVTLSDLAYKNGNPADGVEPYYWKVLVDRRMYGNDGRYLEQKWVALTSDTDKYTTTFAKNNAGSAREYSKEKSAKTLEWIDRGGVSEVASGLDIKDGKVKIRDFLGHTPTKAEMQTKWSTRDWFEDPDASAIVSNNPVLLAMEETIANAVGSKGTRQYLMDAYKQYPELDYLSRIQEEGTSGKTAKEFKALIQSIKNAQLVDDIRWFIPTMRAPVFNANGGMSVYDYDQAAKAAKYIHKICDERIETLLDKGGTNMGFKENQAFTLDEIKNLFNNLNTHAELVPLADKVFDMVRQLNIAYIAKTVGWEEKRSTWPRNAGYWLGNASKETSKTGLIVLQPKVFNSGAFPDTFKAETLLHESIHALTAHAITAWERAPWLIPNSRKQAGDVLGLISDLRKLLTYAGFPYDSSGKTQPKPYYGQTNNAEFLAEMANPEFRELLRNANHSAIDSGLAMWATTRSWLKASNAEETALSALDYLLSSFDMDDYMRVENMRIVKVPKGNPKYSIKDVAPVQPTNNWWKRTHTTEEAMAIAKAYGVDMWKVNAESSEESNPTQMKDRNRGTTSTYRKVYDYLGKDYDGRILDASSGAGIGTEVGREMGYDVTDIEPYPGKTYTPQYQDYTALDDAVAAGEVEPFDFIISNAVLNVVPQDQRDGLVTHMGHMLAPGGRMFVHTRAKREIEELGKKAKNVHLGYGEAVESARGSYQYGFNQKELEAYLQDVLGSDYTVTDGRKAFNVNEATALVTKKSSDTKFSTKDSDGRTLTPEQQEYFKDSKVRDENGNLLVVYHGSHRLFTKFNGGVVGNFFARKFNVATGYAGNLPKDGIWNPAKAQSFETLNGYLDSIGVGLERKNNKYIITEYDGETTTFGTLKEVTDYVTDQYLKFDLDNAAVYQVYLNITNPFVLEAKDNAWNALPKNASGASTTDDVAMWAKEHGYDGVIFRNVVDGWRWESDDVYVTFDANQQKDVKNKKPTSNPDIRYSTKDIDNTTNVSERVDGMVSFFSGGGTLDYRAKKELGSLIHQLAVVEKDDRISRAYALNEDGTPIGLGKGTDVRDFIKDNKFKRGEVAWFHASPACCNYSGLKNGQNPSHEIDDLTAKATADFIGQVLPKVFTLENVAGYRNSAALRFITNALAKNGYRYRIGMYQAAQFGAAANRRRLLLVATRDGELVSTSPYKIKSPGWKSMISDAEIEKMEDANLTDVIRQKILERGVDPDNPGDYWFINAKVQFKHLSMSPSYKPTPTFVASSSQYRILTPDGKFKRVSPETAAKLMGIEGFKTPENQELAFRILGNGVSGELTASVLVPTIAQNLSVNNALEITPEVDRAYLDAVAEGDVDTYTDLFYNYVLNQASANIVPMVSAVNYQGHHAIAKMLKSEDPAAIDKAATAMAPFVPKDAVLVPLPSRTGYATDTLALAKAIGRKTHTRVANALRGIERASVYESKKAGKPLSVDDLGVYQFANIPEDKTVVFIDNVVASGVTGAAAVRAVGRGVVLAYAYGNKTIPTVALKSAEPVTYDSNGNVIPLSERFNVANNDIRYSTKDEDEIPYGGKAYLTPERVDTYLKDFAIPDRPNRSQAWIARISPRDFWRSTSNFDTYMWLREDTKTLDPDKLKSQRQPIYFDVDLDSDGEPIAITGHEGRHRSMAMANEGIYQEPVILFDYGHWTDNRKEFSVLHLRGQGKNPLDYAVWVYDAIPLDYAHHDAIVEKFATPTKEEQLRERYGIRKTLQYSLKEDLSPNEYLASAVLDNIRKPEDRAGLEEYLNRHKELYQETTKLSNEITDLENKLHDSTVLSDSDRESIESRIKALRKDVRENEKKMWDIVSKPRMQRIIEQQRATIQEYEEEMAKAEEKSDKKIAELRARMDTNVRAEIDKRIAMRKRMLEQQRTQRSRYYYLPRIEKASKELRKNLEKAPMPFREPIADFLAALDTRTLDAQGNIKENKANARKTNLIAALNNMSRIAGTTEEWLNKYNVDFNPEMVTWIDEMVEYLSTNRRLLDYYGDINLTTLSADMLEGVYKMVRSLNTTLKNLTKSYTNKALDISEEAKAVMEFDGKLSHGAADANMAEKIFRWKNAQATTVYQRMGDGGWKMYKLLVKGQSKLAFNEQQIVDFAKSHWRPSDIRNWNKPKNAVAVEISGEKVMMTPAQMMALYATSRDADGLRHLLEGGGFKLLKQSSGNKMVVDVARHMTEMDLANVINALNEYDPKLIKLTEEIQDFIGKTGAEWGNEVSVARFGYEQFGIENYFPLHTVAADKVGTVTRDDADAGKFYSMLNRSFTKERTFKANNALVIDGIFDIFANHMSQMALYNAYALPVLDTARFMNWEVNESVGGKPKVTTLGEVWDKAFGKGEMRNYLTNLLDSIAGAKRMDAFEAFALAGLRLHNRVAVAANFRVAAQQPFSITRAFDEIAPKYFTIPKNIKALQEEMWKNSGIALWKHQGNYDTNIKGSLTSQVMGAKTGFGQFKDDLSEKAMWLAEQGDDYTWAAIWNACKNYISETQPTLTDKAYMDAVVSKFEDVVLLTQVVDTPLQKSEWMREKSFWFKMTSSFKSEPTTSYNMLLRTFDRLSEAKQSGKTGAAWAVVKGPMLRAFATYALTSLVNAMVTAVIDAARDDDDYETLLEKLKFAFIGDYRGKNFGQWITEFMGSNVGDSINPIKSLPWFADIFSLAEGYDADRADLTIFEEILTQGKAIWTAITKGDMTYKKVFKLVDGLSKVLGIPFANVLRDVSAVWNTVFGRIDSTVKLQISPESKQSGYNAFYDALRNGDGVRAMQIVDEIASNEIDSKTAYTGVTSVIRKAYKDGKIDKDEALEYMLATNDYFDRGFDRAHIKDQVDGWKQE